MRFLRTAAILILTALLFAGCAPKDEDLAGEPAATAEPTEESFYRETPDAEATFRRSTLYFLSDEGYIVPVTKLIPWEEGIAKACLSYMTSTPTNDEAARRMGLSTVIPAGVAVSLSIKDGNALVDLNGLEPLSDSLSELAMVQGIVNTLVGFPTVNTVTITVMGAGGTLENGTELPVRQGAYPLNPEKTDVMTMAGAQPVTLWFANASGAVTVPVTRYLDGGASLYSTVRALLDGTGLKGLMSCFPENTLLLGAALEHGTVTVNLSDDFKNVTKTEGLYTLAYRTLYLTLAEKYSFETLKIQVNGVDYSPEKVEAPSGVNAR